MKTYLKNLARRRRPDIITRTRMIWTLLNLGFFQVRLVLMYRSDALGESAICTRNRRVLVHVFEGELREHRKGDFAPLQGVDFYHVVQDGAIWTATHYRAPCSLRYRQGDVRSIELFPAVSASEKIIDFNQWAEGEEFIRDADRQAWAVTVSWGD